MVAETASMEFATVNLCILEEFIRLGAHIRTPPLFSHVTLSHLISTWSSIIIVTKGKAEMHSTKSHKSTVC